MSSQDSIYIKIEDAMIGLSALKSVQTCILAYDENHEVLCWFYDLNGLGIELIMEYYEHNGLNKFDIHVHNKKIKNRSPQMKNILGKKVCILDDKLVTYDVVEKHAETHKIKGYKPGKLKHTLNKFKTIN